MERANKVMAATAAFESEVKQYFSLPPSPPSLSFISAYLSLLLPLFIHRKRKMKKGQFGGTRTPVVPCDLNYMMDSNPL